MVGLCSDNCIKNGSFDMKKERKTIHIARHAPTGAKVPIVVDKMNDSNVIEKYHEYTDKRKGFTLEMLQNRWDKSRDDTIELLQQYQVPAHIDYQEVKRLEKNQQPIDVAIFFEEYIYGIENKTKIIHNKLKSRSLHENDTEH